MNKANKIFNEISEIIEDALDKIDALKLGGETMEANRKEKCNFDVKIKNDIWNITACWLSAATDNVCWYEGMTKRDSINVYRTFSPDEIKLPEVKVAA